MKPQNSIKWNPETKISPKPEFCTRNII